MVCMFFVHTNGHLVTVKTNQGHHFIAFVSLVDGQAFLRSKQVSCSLDVMDEILRLNPEAFSLESKALYLPTRGAIEMFIADPKNFPTGEYLVPLNRLRAIPNSMQRPSAEDKQDEFGF